jgi:hypothetical protein
MSCTMPTILRGRPAASTMKRPRESSVCSALSRRVRRALGDAHALPVVGVDHRVDHVDVRRRAGREAVHLRHVIRPDAAAGAEVVLPRADVRDLLRLGEQLLLRREGLGRRCALSAPRRKGVPQRGDGRETAPRAARGHGDSVNGHS